MGYPDRLNLQLEAWKKVVDVQQHFNDMEMRIRTLCLTVLGTIWGAAAYSSGQGTTTVILGFKTPLATYLLWLAVLVVFLFWLMDGGWYHYFLRGAVSTGQKLEDEMRESLPGVNLTGSISKNSHVYVWGRQVTSATRGTVFYGSLILFSLSFAVVSHIPRDLLRHAIILWTIGFVTLLCLLYTGLRTSTEVTAQMCKVCGGAVNSQQHCEACDRQQTIDSRGRSWWRIAGGAIVVIAALGIFVAQFRVDILSFAHF